MEINVPNDGNDDGKNDKKNIGISGTYKDNELRLSGMIQHGSSQDIECALLKIRANLIEAAQWVQKNKERDNKNLLLHNFLTAAAPYVEIAAVNRDGYVQILALCARSLYEISLLSRYAQKDKLSLEHWAAEAMTDRLEMLKGCRDIDPNDSVGQLQTIQTEIDRLETLANESNLKVSGHLNISELAKFFGKEAEHSSLFKIFSKLLHPTSYLVNTTPEEIQSIEIRKTLIIHVQLYAIDILGTLQVALEFPSNPQE